MAADPAGWGAERKADAKVPILFTRRTYKKQNGIKDIKLLGSRSLLIMTWLC